MPKEILEMIEKVSPEDGATLDEIDALARIYIHKLDEFKTTLGIAQKYTRSRDALKAIRPEGWDLMLDTHWGTPYAKLYRRLIDPTNPISEVAFSPALPTEELAELHAILQALEYERNAK